MIHYTSFWLYVAVCGQERSRLPEGHSITTIPEIVNCSRCLDWMSLLGSPAVNNHDIKIDIVTKPKRAVEI